MLLPGVVRRSSSLFGLATLFFLWEPRLVVRRDYAMDGNYSYTNRWGMVSNRNLDGGIFDCCPLAAEKLKMYQKSHFFERVDDFVDFSRSYTDKITKSKTNLSRPDISPNNPRNCFSKISSSFWDRRYHLGTSDVKNMGDFKSEKHVWDKISPDFNEIVNLSWYGQRTTSTTRQILGHAHFRFDR